MRIGIDVRSIQESAIHRGIGKYVVSLLRLLSHLDKVNEYYLFLYSTQADFAQSQLPHGSQFNFVFIAPPKLRTRKFIRTFVIAKETLLVDRYDLDVLLQLDKSFPVVSKSAPIVSVVHDLIPQLFKHQYQVVRLRSWSVRGIVIYLKELRLRQINNRAMKNHQYSDKVIAISEHTARDLKKVTNVTDSKIVVIPHGAETIALNIKSRRPKNIPKEARFVFYVGGADPRKQLPLLVEQFSTLTKEHPTLLLVIAGKEATNLQVPQAVLLQDKIRDLKLTKNVILTGYVSDEELAYLYEHSIAFVLASSYEGFGMPVLEAFQAGCPVVAYNNSSIPEVAGDAALLIDENKSLAPAINRLVNERKLRDTLIKKGRSRALKFTWERTARETLNVLREAGQDH